jgi:DNA polymerase-3 subunit epsilon
LEGRALSRPATTERGPPEADTRLSPTFQHSYIPTFQFEITKKMNPGYSIAREARFGVIDFETTGAVPGFRVEPWQVGVVMVEQGVVQGEMQYESLFHIGDRPFNLRAPGRHAKIRDQLAAAPTPSEVLPALVQRLSGVPVVAHNIGTERSQLMAMAPLHKFGPWIDTLKLTRHAYPALESKSLEDVIQTLALKARVDSLCPGREAHDALYDAVACAVLLEHFLSLPGWERVTVEALSEA